eukprot:3532110-Rhodomonas_salina.1
MYQVCKIFSLALRQNKTAVPDMGQHIRQHQTRYPRQYWAAYSESVGRYRSQYGCEFIGRYPRQYQTWRSERIGRYRRKLGKLRLICYASFLSMK